MVEIFRSIQGESSYAGLPCGFVRLAECNLRCSYCDTTYAYQARFELPVSDVVGRVKELACPLVLITGGEPLLQDEVYPLMEELFGAGHKVLLETNGSLSLARVDPRVVKIVDVKCPGSGEADKNRWENLSFLTSQDEVKFVFCDQQDYKWACTKVREHSLDSRFSVLFSPAFGQLDARMLAQWIVSDGLGVRLQLQLHKLIWGLDAQGV